MQFRCPKCDRTLTFDQGRPAFCAYCGHPLASSAPAPTGDNVEATRAFPTSAATALTGASTAVPTELGGYRLLGQLGAGGMGTVYEAEEVASGRRVAVKLLAADFTESSDALERFRQEGRIASMLTHPRCVFVLAVAEEAGQPYLVMERMPGDTLKELIDRRGPLPPEESVARILDVIEGLQEAHRLGVIHRDVKPSNCLLEADGRVKVGDFGLARPTTPGGHLTRTGAFVGTPHFASPEQVRGEPVDPRTDVYGVAATLYYLLTGQPPFSGRDSAATLARIVSDPAPSLRSLRPELPPSLDRVVQRGLERDRESRWPDLETFRQALLALAPGPGTLPELALRAAGFLLDLVVLGFLAILSAWLPGESFVIRGAAYLVLFLLYFTGSEHLWGGSPGKAVFRLRVCGPRWVDPPGWGRAALRAGLCFALTHLGPLAGAVTPAAGVALGLLGLLVLAAAMRAGNGYRGLHEILSGTRTVRLSLPARRPVLLGGGWLLSFLGSRRLDQGRPPSGLPERIGRFTLRAVLKWSAEDKVLLGEDASMGRRVFLWLRPQSAPPLDRARRDVGRRTRLRWLACGRQGDLQWDAILAPTGCPLPEFVHSEGSLSWSDARPLLEDLSGELSAACADGTLPRLLTVAQVWVQADGHTQLADTPLTAGPQEEGAGPEGTDQERGLALLRRVAALALDGRPGDPRSPARARRGAVPPDARAALERLSGVGPRYDTVEQFRADLAAGATQSS